MTHEANNNSLTPQSAAGMTVNERLWLGGLMDAYDSAVEKGDVKVISEILKRVYLTDSDIDSIIGFALKTE